MTVRDLIESLQKYNDDMIIKYSNFSEGIQMDISSVDIEDDMSDKEKDIVVIQG